MAVLLASTPLFVILTGNIAEEPVFVIVLWSIAFTISISFATRPDILYALKRSPSIAIFFNSSSLNSLSGLFFLKSLTAFSQSISETYGS